MAGKFGVAQMTGEPFSAAFEFDRDDISFSVVMSAPRFLIHVHADDTYSMNLSHHYRFKTEMGFGNQETRNRILWALSHFWILGLLNLNFLSFEPLVRPFFWTGRFKREMEFETKTRSYIRRY